jgi:hypothetical protein
METAAVVLLLARDLARSRVLRETGRKREHSERDVRWRFGAQICASKVATRGSKPAGVREDGLHVCTYRADRAAEEQDVGLWAVDLIVDPAAGLHDAEAAPLGLGKQTRRVGKALGNVAGEQDMAVLVHVVRVAVRVLNLSHLRPQRREIRNMSA